MFNIHVTCLAPLYLPTCSQQYIIVNFVLMNRTSACFAYKGKYGGKLTAVNIKMWSTHELHPLQQSALWKLTALVCQDRAHALLEALCHSDIK